MGAELTGAEPTGAEPTATGTAFVHEALAQRVVFGAGAARTALQPEVDRLGAVRVLLVVADSERATAATLTASLPVVATFTGVRPHVPVEVARAARESAAASAPDTGSAPGAHR